jgi:hypothetical protein
MATMPDSINVQVSVTPAPPTGFWNAMWKICLWCASFFDGTKPSTSMKRLTMFMAACTLCYTALRLTHAICHQIWYGMNVDTQTATIVGVSYGILATMAGVAYFKRDAQGGITVESTKQTDDKGATDAAPTSKS